MKADVMGPALEREHRQWIEELKAVLEPAQRAEAGTWARWNALRYLQTTFSARLDRERRLVERLQSALTGSERELLWALGELLAALRQQLDQMISLCHQPERFSSITGKLLTALEYWCGAVEKDLGALPIASLVSPSREELAQLEAEAVHG
jgi:hypothetical protein